MATTHKDVCITDLAALCAELEADLVDLHADVTVYRDLVQEALIALRTLTLVTERQSATIERLLGQRPEANE